MKGGCEIGRKNEPKGGCKVGKKLKFKVNKPAAKPAPKKLKFKVNKPVAKPAPKKLKIKINKPVVKKLESQLSKVTGLSNAEANKMNPTQLFGMLPTELRTMITTPSKRGGGVSIGSYTSAEFKNDLEKIYKIEFPRGRFGSANANKELNSMARQFLDMAGRKLKRGTNYKNIKLSTSLDRKKLRNIVEESMAISKKQAAKALASKASSKVVDRAEDEKRTRSKLKIGQTIRPDAISFYGDDATRELVHERLGEKGKIVKFTATGVSIKMDDGKMRSIKYNRAKHL